MHVREYTDFVLVKTVRPGDPVPTDSTWFQTLEPVSWSAARDRIAGLGLLDPEKAGRRDVQGGWMLSVDPAEVDLQRRAGNNPVTLE